MSNAQQDSNPFSVVMLTNETGNIANIYPYGAHLSSWKTSTGKEWIFLSERARFQQGLAIRGGVPIIFPQFNAFGSGPRHGFARNLTWRHVAIEGRADECKFILSESDKTLLHWPYPFKAEYYVKLNSDQLSMRLSVINTGQESFTFTCALHTYFSVSNLNKAVVCGLNGLEYWNNDGSVFTTRHLQKEDSLCFSGAIDRVYFKSHSPLTLRDGEHSLTIASEGFRDVVIWNPGEQAASAMSDFLASEHDKMLCIEAACIDAPITIKPGESWVGAQVLNAEV